MKSDTLKTLAGLGVIALIVVATFLYGNSQRQAQLERERAATQSPAAKTSPVATASSSPRPSASSTSMPSLTMSQAPTGRAPQPTVASVATTQGPREGAMPAAGPEIIPVIGMGAMVVAFGWWRRSRRLATGSVRK